MGILGTKSSPLRREEAQQPIYDSGGNGGNDSLGDDSSSYEPPTLFSTNTTVTDQSETASEPFDVVTAQKTETSTGKIEATAKESFQNVPWPDIEESSTSYVKEAEKEKTKSNTNATDIPSGCFAAEVLEISYDKGKIANLTTKSKASLQWLSSFCHRWRSFRDDHLVALRLKRLWSLERNTKDGEDDGCTLSSAGSTKNSFGYFSTEANEDTNSEEYQHFGSFGRCGANAKKCPDKKSYHIALDTDLDVLAKHPCNEYARRQFEVWRAASIEGPRGLKTTAFLLAMVLLLCTLGLIVVRMGQHYWSLGAIVACCHLLVALLLILLLESRSNLTGKGILRDLVTCGCSGKTVEEDLTDHFYHVTILPMDAYQEYGDQHYTSEDQASKPRHDIVKQVRFFRFLFGRGFLCIFAGSMAICAIPGHLVDYLDAALIVGLPGILLMLVGLIAIAVGLRATFRWTLLETSIVGGEEHLMDKFRSAGHSIYDESEHESVANMRLNQEGFCVLVTTLGLDLDEETLIPTVYALEVRPKDPEAMTFEEFYKWWKGQRVCTNRKKTRSPGTPTCTSTEERVEETELSSLPSSSHHQEGSSAV